MLGFTLVAIAPLSDFLQVFHARPAANTTNGEVHPIPTGVRLPHNPNQGGQVMGRPPRLYRVHPIPRGAVFGFILTHGAR